MGFEGDIGAVIGGYRLEKLLGSGGMGTVYLATHQLLGRKAAVKVLADALANDSSFVSRFFHEARVVNDARHPNIVDIIDFVKSDQPPRIAYIMEHIDGPALSEVISPYRLTPIQALNIARHIGSALTAVHALQVIHRDLKPANVMLAGSLDSTFEAERSAKILDFGIAKVSDPDSKHLTVTGATLGTPAYMAPEQLAGHSVSPATDVYALAEILYEMLAGRPAFDGDNMCILKAKVIDGPADLDLPVDVPAAEEVLKLTRACLRFEPMTRPSLPAVMEALDSWVPRFAAADALHQRPGRSLALPSSSASPIERLRRATVRSTVVPLPSRQWATAGGVLLGLAACLVMAIVVLGGDLWNGRPISAVAELVAAPTIGYVVDVCDPLPTRVRLETHPSGATVRSADGQWLGRTPLDLDVTESSSRLTLEHEGYADRELQLTPESPIHRVELEPEVSGAQDRRGATPPTGEARKKRPKKPSRAAVRPLGKRELPEW